MKQPDRFGIMVLSVAAAIAVLLSVMAYFSTNSAALPNIAGTIAAPFRAAAAAIRDSVYHILEERGELM